MTSPTEITVSQLSRLIGTPDAPALIDVRTDEDFDSDPRLMPGAIRKRDGDVSQWGEEFAGQPAIVICYRGQKLAQGVAAWLRCQGVVAETLEGGFTAWAAADRPLINGDKVPPRDVRGRTVWVTRARPKIDRIACPWLIRRFIDPQAAFLYVAPSEVLAVAERFAATPFDVNGVFWSHRGDQCSFDTMVEEFGLGTEPLTRLAAIVRGADTARLDLAPEAAGLLAVSLGLSRMFKDDIVQLEAGMMVYDALYRWCRDATSETHNWPSPAKVS